MALNAIKIIEDTDANEVGRLYRTDERAIALLSLCNNFLVHNGFLLSKDQGSAILELFRTTYYLGYQRGKTIGQMPTFLEPKEKP